MESTVLDCTKKIPIILRPGGITKEQIEKVIGDVEVFHSVNSIKQAQSPGMKYKHYSPEVPLWIVKGNIEKLQSIIKHEQSHLKRIGLLASTNTLEKLQADQHVDLGNNLKDIAANF